MALSIDFGTLTISVPQADLTLIQGSLYSMDTEAYFRAEVNALMDDEEGIVFEDPISHNSTYSVFGETYARKIEVINGYSITFTPNTDWSVKLLGSNNNLADLEEGILNKNLVLPIPTNSGGLIEGRLSAADVAQLFAFVMEDGETFEQTIRLIRASAAGDVVQQADGSYVIKSKDGLKDRITGDDAANSGRTISATDST